VINLLFLLGDVLEKGFIGIILTLDTLIYGLISSAFKVFMAIASARLLSSDAYYTIASKVYLIIGVLMLFVLSYAMLKAIVNPDEGKKSFGPGIIKRIVIAVIGLAIAPALFNLMYQVQGLVLEHNVLGKLFFRSDNTTLVSPGTVDVGGQQITLEDSNPDNYINVVGGSVTATTIWQAFFYPAEDSGLTSDDIVGNLSDYYLSTAGWYGLGCAAGVVGAVGYAFGWTGFGLAIGLLGTAVAALTCDDAVENLGTAIATDEEITLSQAYAMTAKGDSQSVELKVKNNSTGAVGSELDATLSTIEVVSNSLTKDTDASTDTKVVYKGTHFTVVAEWVDASDLLLEAARDGVEAGMNKLKITITLNITVTEEIPQHAFTIKFNAKTA
jgi:hypothetical protein